jgi:hypothetical protein
MQFKGILTFFFERGQLSRVTREGWRRLGVAQPESGKPQLEAMPHISPTAWWHGIKKIEG